ncbi:MAG: CHASE2 domain-containing protein [Muribaculaceae bacterium]|nr:CHASE2 domain-containing protein [Muribaculaceae bacterium]
MKRLSETMSSLPLPIKSVVITVMTLLFSHVVVYDLMSVSFFSPMEKASDFRFSDFYTIVADDRAVSTLDEDIVIVPVDGYTRRDIARTIDDIDFCEPGAVGLDIAFAPPSDPDDDPLAESLACCENLVMPVRVSSDDDGIHTQHLSYYDDIVIPKGGFAAVNIQGDAGERTTVREFSRSFKTEEGIVASLPSALIKLARPKAAEKLAERPEHDEFIKFASRKFDIIDPEEIVDNPDLIKGKIVLVGKMQNAGDLHVTPLDNFMPGLLIHAHTTATMLSGDFIRELTPFESYAVAAITCFLIVLINMRLWESPAGPLVVRVVQFAMLYAMIIGGTMAYIYYGIDLNFAFAILSTSLGVAACDIYIGLFTKNGVCDRIANIFKKTNNDRI